MRKNILSLIIILNIVLTSCVKLDEGPRYSLFSKNQRLSREWILDSAGTIINFDSVPLTSTEMKDLKLVFDKDGGLKYFESDSLGILKEYLTSWTWQLQGYLIETNFNQSQNFIINDNRKYVVKRLTRKLLILQDHVNGHRLYFHSK